MVKPFHMLDISHPGDYGKYELFFWHRATAVLVTLPSGRRVRGASELQSSPSCAPRTEQSVFTCSSCGRNLCRLHSPRAGALRECPHQVQARGGVAGHLSLHLCSRSAPTVLQLSILEGLRVSEKQVLEHQGSWLLAWGGRCRDDRWSCLRLTVLTNL